MDNQGADLPADSPGDAMRDDGYGYDYEYGGYDARVGADRGAQGICGSYADIPADCPVVGYVPSAKSKARLVCSAFVQGAGGVVLQPPPSRLGPGAAAFFGVLDATLPLWRQARAQNRDWYYLDNAYFDVVRGRLFRAVRNAVQASGRDAPDWKRWAALGVKIRPWQKQGRHIVLVAQSETYMRVVAGYQGCWWRDALARLQAHTDRPITIRPYRANKMALAATLKDALKNCWALVTWSSAAANEALLAGIPVFAAGECAATPMAMTDLSQIETPSYPDGREAWAAALAGRQWSLEQLRDGTAWRALQA